jgi:hypothetical protein
LNTAVIIGEADAVVISLRIESWLHPQAGMTPLLLQIAWTPVNLPMEITIRLSGDAQLRGRLIRFPCSPRSVISPQ